MMNQVDNERVRRIGEQDVPVTFRTNRFFTSGENWYFSTREGIDLGPYDSRIMAHDAMQQYIREKQSTV